MKQRFLRNLGGISKAILSLFFVFVFIVGTPISYAQVTCNGVDFASLLETTASQTWHANAEWVNTYPGRATPPAGTVWVSQDYTGVSAPYTADQTGLNPAWYELNFDLNSFAPSEIASLVASVNVYSDNTIARININGSSQFPGGGDRFSTPLSTTLSNWESGSNQIIVNTDNSSNVQGFLFDVTSVTCDECGDNVQQGTEECDGGANCSAICECPSGYLDDPGGNGCVSSTYTLTFDPSGGSVSPTSKTVTFNQAYGELPTPTYSGRTFKRWMDENDATVNSGTIHSFLGDDTIFAEFYCLITWNGNLGAGHTPTSQENGCNLVDVLPTTNPTRAGYIFVGWFTAPSGGSPVIENVTPVTSNVTFYAQWILDARTYTCDNGNWSGPYAYCDPIDYNPLSNYVLGDWVCSDVNPDDDRCANPNITNIIGNDPLICDGNGSVDLQITNCTEVGQNWTFTLGGIGYTAFVDGDGYATILNVPPGQYASINADGPGTDCDMSIESLPGDYIIEIIPLACPLLSIDDPADYEGNTLAFTISLDSPATQQVSFFVDFNIGFSDATAGVDFSGDILSWMGVINTGFDTFTINIPLFNDAIYEEFEYIHMDVNGIVGANVGDVLGVGQIIDATPIPVVSIQNATGVEGSILSFQVLQTYESVYNTVVRVSTQTGTAGGSDFIQQILSSVTIPAGSTGVSHTVTTLEDGLQESTELFRLSPIVIVQGIANVGSSGTGFILDDDPLCGSGMLQLYYRPQAPTTGDLCSHGVATTPIYSAGVGWTWGCDLNGGSVSCSATERYCGDGLIGTGIGYTGQEQCDDGNGNSGDGCDSSCQLELPVCLDFNFVINPNSGTEPLSVTGTFEQVSGFTITELNWGTGLPISNPTSPQFYTYSSGGLYTGYISIENTLSGSYSISCNANITVSNMPLTGACDNFVQDEIFYYPDEPNRYNLCSVGSSTGYTYQSGTGWTWTCLGVNSGNSTNCNAIESYCGDGLIGTGIGYISGSELCDDGNSIDNDSCNNSCQPTSGMQLCNFSYQGLVTAPGWLNITGMTGEQRDVLPGSGFVLPLGDGFYSICNGTGVSPQMDIMVSDVSGAFSGGIFDYVQAVTGQCLPQGFDQNGINIDITFQAYVSGNAYYIQTCSDGCFYEPLIISCEGGVGPCGDGILNSSEECDGEEGCDGSCQRVAPSCSNVSVIRDPVSPYSGGTSTGTFSTTQTGVSFSGGAVINIPIVGGTNTGSVMIVNSGGSATCYGTVTGAYCGDGNVNGGGEQCDDGNANNDDACSNSCIYNIGDPILYPLDPQDYVCGECQNDNECDVGMVCRNSICLPRLFAPCAVSSECYQGLISPNQVLSTAAMPSGADVSYATIAGSTTMTCNLSQCALSGYNGQVRSGTVDIDLCTCGNTLVEQGTSELCDDGNVNNGDGCSNTCNRETPQCSAFNFTINPSAGSAPLTVTGTFSTVTGFTVTQLSRGSGSPISNPTSPQTNTYGSNGLYTGTLTVVNAGSGSLSSVCSLGVLVSSAPIDGECDPFVFGENFYFPADEPINYTLCAVGVATGYVYQAGTGWTWDCVGLNGGADVSCDAFDSYCGDGLIGTGIGYISGSEQCDDGNSIDNDMCNNSCQRVAPSCSNVSVMRFPVSPYSGGTSTGTFSSTQTGVIFSGGAVINIPIVGGVNTGSVMIVNSGGIATCSVTVTGDYCGDNTVNVGEACDGGFGCDSFCNIIPGLNSLPTGLCTYTFTEISQRSLFDVFYGSPDNSGRLNLSGPYVLFNQSALLESDIQLIHLDSTVTEGGDDFPVTLVFTGVGSGGMWANATFQDGSTGSVRPFQSVCLQDCSGFAVTISGNVPLTCNDGEVTLTASGANNYVWSNGATGSTILVTGTGTYTVTGTTLSGCIASDEVTVVGNITNLTATGTGTNTSACGLSDGTVTVVGSPMSAGLEYQLSGGAWQGTGHFTGLSAGAYTVNVRDVSNQWCGQTSVMVTVNDGNSSLPAITITGTTQLTCQTQSTLLSVEGAEGGWTYLWSNGSTGFELPVTGAGVYGVTVSSGSCMGIDTIQIFDTCDIQIDKRILGSGEYVGAGGSSYPQNVSEGSGQTNANGSVMSGDWYVYRIAVTNNGLGTVTGVEMTDLVPGYLTVFQATNNGFTSLYREPNYVSGYVATLAESATVSTDVRVMVNGGTGTICNEANVQISSGGDTLLGNNSEQSCVDVGVCATNQTCAGEIYGQNFIRSDNGTTWTSDLTCIVEASCGYGGEYSGTAASLTYGTIPGLLPSDTIFVPLELGGGTWSVTYTSLIDLADQLLLEDENNGDSFYNYKVDEGTSTLFYRVGRHWAECRVPTCAGEMLRTYEPVGSLSWIEVDSLPEADQSTADGVAVIASEDNNNHQINGQCTCDGQPDCSGGNGCNAECGLGADPDCGTVCGNGVIEVGEVCDDGNVLDGDGCSSICQLECAVTISGNVPLTCNDDEVELIASGADNYVWSNGATGTTIIVTGTGTYTVTGTTLSGCIASDSETVIGNITTLTATGTGIQTSACGLSDGTVTVVGSPMSVGLEYQLSGGAWQGTGHFTGLAAGVYTVNVRDVSNQWCGQTSIMVTVSDGLPVLQAINVTGTTQLTCQTNNTLLSVEGAGGGWTYEWSNGSTGFELPVTGAGTYGVDVYSGGCMLGTGEIIVADTCDIQVDKRILSSTEYVGPGGSSYPDSVSEGEMESNASGSVMNGDRYVYRVMTRNNGLETATGIRVSDMIPSGLEIFQVVNNGYDAYEWVPDYFSGSVNSLGAGGEVYADLWVRVLGTGGSTICNEVNGVLMSRSDTMSGNNTEESCVDVGVCAGGQTCVGEIYGKDFSTNNNGLIRVSDVTCVVEADCGYGGEYSGTAAGLIYSSMGVANNGTVLIPLELGLGDISTGYSSLAQLASILNDMDYDNGDTFQNYNLIGNTLFYRVGRHRAECRVPTCAGDLLRTYVPAGGGSWSDINSLGVANQSSTDGTDVIDSEDDNNHTTNGVCTCDGCVPGEELIGGICCMDVNNNGTCDSDEGGVCSGFSINISGNSPLSCGVGSVTLTANGGTEYSWSNGSTGGSIIVNGTGTYSVFGTGVFGCTGNAQVTVVGNTTNLSATGTGTNTSACGQSDGTVTVVGSPMSTGLQYQMSGGAWQGTGYFTGLTAGAYTVNVRDVNNQWCGQTSMMVTVSDGNSNQSITITGNAQLTCQTPNTVLSVEGTGMSYLWSNGSTGSTILVAGTGTYSVIGTTVSGCIASDLFIVTGNRTNLTAIGIGTQTSSCGLSDGTVTVVGSPMSIGLEYQMSGGAWQGTGHFTGLAAGVYTVNVRDVSNQRCGQTSVLVTVSDGNSSLPAIVVTGNTQLTCLSTGTLLSVENSNGGWNYLWSNGSTGFELPVTGAGIYGVTVNSGACVGAASIEVIDTCFPIDCSADNTCNPNCAPGADVDCDSGYTKSLLGYSGSLLQYQISGTVASGGTITLFDTLSSGSSFTGLIQVNSLIGSGNFNVVASGNTILMLGTNQGTGVWQYQILYSAQYTNFGIPNPVCNSIQQVSGSVIVGTGMSICDCPDGRDYCAVGNSCVPGGTPCSGPNPTGPYCSNLITTIITPSGTGVQYQCIGSGSSYQVTVSNSSGQVIATGTNATGSFALVNSGTYNVVCAVQGDTGVHCGGNPISCNQVFASTSTIGSQLALQSPYFAQVAWTGMLQTNPCTGYIDLSLSGLITELSVDMTAHFISTMITLYGPIPNVPITNGVVTSSTQNIQTAVSQTIGSSCQETCRDIVNFGGYCGNGIVEAGETCDGTPGCRSNCTRTSGPPGGICGNGIINPGETCDQGTGNTTTCTIPVGLNECTYCSTTCKLETIKIIIDDFGYCGDGKINSRSREQCDEGSKNTTTCTIKSGENSCSYCSTSCIIKYIGSSTTGDTTPGPTTPGPTTPGPTTPGPTTPGPTTPGPTTPGDTTPGGSTGGPSGGGHKAPYTDDGTCTKSGVFDPKYCVKTEPKCAEVDPPSIMIGEYLPYRWDLEMGNEIDETASSCGELEAGKFIPGGSVLCTFELYNGASQKSPIHVINNVPCFDDKRNMSGVTLFDEMKGGGSAGRLGSNRLMMSKELTRGIVGEYQIVLSRIDYTVCNDKTPQSKTFRGTTLDRVCAMNFAVSDPYLLHQGTIFSVLQETNLRAYRKVDGRAILSKETMRNLQQSVMARYPNTNIGVIMGGWLEKQNNRAVQQASLSQLTSAFFRKVPTDPIYIYDGGVSREPLIIRGSSNILSPITVIVYNADLIIEGSLKGKHMYLVPDGKILFASNNCDERDVVEGIFMTNKGVLTNKIRNDNLQAKNRCEDGRLLIEGILVSPNIDRTFIESRRGNLDEWFDITTESQEQKVYESASILLRSTPREWKILPPGANSLLRSILLGVSGSK